ncbi:MAG: hypothetical protein AAGI53_04205 [Planctomycetota bacterium]
MHALNFQAELSIKNCRRLASTLKHSVFVWMNADNHVAICFEPGLGDDHCAPPSLVPRPIARMRESTRHDGSDDRSGLDVDPTKHPDKPTLGQSYAVIHDADAVPRAERMHSKQRKNKRIDEHRGNSHNRTAGEDYEEQEGCECRQKREPRESELQSDVKGTAFRQVEAERNRS